MARRSRWGAAWLAAGAATLLAAGGHAARAEVTLSLVHPFPDFLIYTKSCKEMVANINAAGAGVVKIAVRGGDEAIRMFQQPAAVSRGAVDLACTPAAFYAQGIPENEAVSTAGAAPATVRRNGGMALIDELHQRHYNMKYIGWIDSGPQFHIYMAEPPKFKPDGLPEFAGVKMRDNPIFGAFFRALGASTHNMAATEVYSALEKRVVDATGWTSIGLMQLKWDEFVTHRIDPGFYQTDIGVVMNLARWQGLSAEARRIVEDEVKQHEETSRTARLAEVAAERDQLASRNMRFHAVPNAEKYLEIALNSAYARMAERLKERNRPLDAAQRLRALYQER